MATVTYTSLDREESANHGALYWGVHAFLRQFVLVAIDLTESTARDMRGYVPARIEAFRRDMRLQ